jgi:hypothetical protein
MKIECIFEIVHGALASIKYTDEPLNAFDHCFSLWSDVEYLENFFETNKADLSRDIWQLDVFDAVVRILEEANEFKQDMLYYAEQGKSKGEKHLDGYIFRSLHKDILSNTRIQSKAYGTENGHSMLRIYAIRLGENAYIVTGGTIKLTKKMQEREHTSRELDKLNLAASYLKNLGIEDDSDFGYLEFSK